MESAERNQETGGVLVDALRRLLDGTALGRLEAHAVMDAILRGEATNVQIGALLTALRLRGETVEELVGFAEAMLAHVRPIFPSAERPAEPLVDTCGTGGDASGTFNVSTAVAFVAAAAGARVAKHGNRSLSSECGSADVLEALGVNILAEPKQIAAAIREVGIGFIFAPAVHTAMKYTQKARRDLRFRTVFNLLGPLTNPARVDAQVLGVFHALWLEPMAEALRELGVRHAFVLHSRDALDEASLSATTEVVEVHDQRISRYEITPDDFALPHASRGALRGGDAGTNANIIERVLDGEPGPRRDIVLMNTALALVAAGRARDFHQGVAQAREAIESGAARERLCALVEFSNRPWRGSGPA